MFSKAFRCLVSKSGNVASQKFDASRGIIVKITGGDAVRPLWRGDEQNFLPIYT